MSSYVVLELADGSCRDLQPAERLDPDGELPEGARLFQRMPPGFSRRLHDRPV